jgi:signal transduction histidine kinase
MTFRGRLLLALAAAALLPLALLASGVRRQIAARLVAQHERRVQALAGVAVQDLTRESDAVARRLDAIAGALADDNRFRLAVQGVAAERAYLLDWAGQAMRVSGLSMLQLQDDAGRILSSGHFRNEFDRLDPGLPLLLAARGDSLAIVAARTPDGPFLALARVDSLRVAGRRFTLVGGIAADRALLERFARDEGLEVTLVTPGGAGLGGDPPPGPAARIAADVPLAYIDTRAVDAALGRRARLVVAHSASEVEALRSDVNRWLLAAVVAAAVVAAALAARLSAGLSRPIAALARAASAVALEGPEVDLVTGRDDEIGTLARRFASMTRRLRASASKLRDAERRATIAEMARQVNHDIKNGLIPIRNVLRHLVEVQEGRPQELPVVFGERRATLESSIGYLDTLARSYARLTPRLEHRPLDVDAIARDVARAASAGAGVPIECRLAGDLPPVMGDALVLHRILDNLARNAVESLGPAGGGVAIETGRGSEGSVRIAVTDTGRGMTPEELSRAFDDFFTTKPGGTGLGLSVVRRLTADLGGSLGVSSVPGEGTTFTLELAAVAMPAAAPGRRQPTTLATSIHPRTSA